MVLTQYWWFLPKADLTHAGDAKLIEQGLIDVEVHVLNGFGELEGDVVGTGCEVGDDGIAPAPVVPLACATMREHTHA